jgi:hypothetical protein
MLKFRSEAEVLKEWDDMIARVKAGEVSLEDAEAFKLKKGSSRQGRPHRDWGENARRKSSGICFYESSITMVKCYRAIANRRSWGVSEPDDDEKYKIYLSFVRLGRITRQTYIEVSDREKKLDEAIAERRGFEAGAAKGNERALTLVDEMTGMKKRHKAELEELKARQKEELRILQEKYEPRWVSYKIKSTDKRQLQGEFAWLYQGITQDENSVRAWGKDKGLTFDALRSELLTTLWNGIPAARRKGVWMADDGSFSYDSLKRHYREHLEDFEPAPVKNPGHVKPESDDGQDCEQ